MAVAIADVVGVHIPSRVTISKAYMVDAERITEGVVVEGEHLKAAVKVIRETFSVSPKTMELVSVGKKVSLLNDDAKRIQRMLLDELEYRTPVRKFHSVLVQRDGVTHYYVSKGQEIGM